jgi:hypothetical protein
MYRSNARVVGQHQPAHAVCHGDVRTPLGQGDLDAGRAPGNKSGQPALADAQQTLVHVGGVHLALDDVEDGDVAALFAGDGGDHAVLGLEQAAHDVEDGGFADRLGLLDLVAGKRGVGGHEEVAFRGGDEGGEDGHQVVVHVARVAQGGGAGGHDGGDELVGLLEGGLLQVQAVGGNVGEGAVVEDDDRVGVLGEAAHGEDAVVGVDDDVARVGGVGEDGVGLDDLFGEAVVEALEEERTQAGAGTAGDGVQQHEALEGVATVGLAVDHLHDFLVDGLAGLVAIAPVVAGADAGLANVEVFGVVDVAVGAGLDAVDDAGLEVDEDGAGDVAGVVALVVEDVFAVTALGGKVLEVAILADAVFLA